MLLELQENIDKKYIGCILTYGHFSTIHPGHVRYLKYARDTNLIHLTALIGDIKNRTEDIYPYSQKNRAESLNYLGLSDGVILLKENELSYAVEKFKPHILLLGNEFETNLDKEILKSIEIQKNRNLRVEFHAGEINYTSTDLFNGSERELSNKRINIFKNACKRQGIGLKNLKRSLDLWDKTQILVIGDTIVDQYAACEPIGLSAEAPVVVVKEIEKKNFVGGAAIVASHISSLGAKCHFISVVGSDNEATFINEKLSSESVISHIITDQKRPTTFKKRYIVENQKLFRVSKFEDRDIDKKTEEEILTKIKKLAPDLKGIVISDFVYGVITPKILKEINAISKKYGLKLFGDLQCSSQVGSIIKFKKFSLLCPNEREARIALGERDIGLELLSQRLLKETYAERIIMKLGSQGFIAYDKISSKKYKTQAFPALSVNPVDVAGAGDSLLATMATGLSSDNDFMITSALACCVAFIAVETLGNQPISKRRLEKFLLEIFK